MAKNKLSQQEVENRRSQRIMNGIATWCSFYRANPHRLCKDYLNINLKLFQKILLFMMNYSTNFMYLASRGQGKTFLVAIFCVVRCILYPGTQICVAAKARGQAMNVLEKITTILMPNSANLRREINEKETVINSSKGCVVFHNGSRIKVVTANDNARSNRSNIIVCDEFRMIDLDVINKVLRKFNTAPRQPKYLNKPEYSHLVERNKELYLSSCWFKSHWSFGKLKAYCKNLLDDTKKYFAVGLPYQLAIQENLLSAEQIEDEMSESDFNAVGFAMEMECMWFGESENALFKFDDLDKQRMLKFPIYPPETYKILSDKNFKPPPKFPGEIRVLTCDIAVMGGKQNDATSIFILQLIPSGERYISNVVFADNLEGGHTADQSLHIRKLYDEYDCSYLVMDASSYSTGIFDAFVRDIFDSSTGKTYSALNCMNNEEMASRCTDPSAPKSIYAVKANAQFNHDSALTLREAFRSGKIKMLLNESEGEEQLKQIKGYSGLSPESKANLLLPYVHTSLLINEMVNLSYETKNANIRIQEKSNARKDRYSSLAMAYYFISQVLEKELRKPKKEINVSALTSLARKPQFH